MTQIPQQRVVVVVGAGRSGTSTVTRGVGALGVELGNCLKPGNRKNPKGFFEDMDILNLNQRLHRCFGLTTTGSDVRLVDEAVFASGAVAELHDEAVAMLARRFGDCALWGFKSGGVLRLLPFWARVFESLAVAPSYVIALRHPASAARSRGRLNPLRGRQEKSDLEWLSRMVPYLHLLRPHPLAVVDFDRLLMNPREQLCRIAQLLDLPIDEGVRQGVEQFSNDFLDPRLRHHVPPNPHDMTGMNPLTASAFRALYQLASDQRRPIDPEFWSDWLEIESRFLCLGPALRHIDYLEDKLRRARWGMDDALRILTRRLLGSRSLSGLAAPMNGFGKAGR